MFKPNNTEFIHTSPRKASFEPSLVVLFVFKVVLLVTVPMVQWFETTYVQTMTCAYVKTRSLKI